MAVDESVDEKGDGALAKVPTPSAGVAAADAARLRDLVRRGRGHLDRSARADKALAAGIGALYDKEYSAADRALTESIAATPDRGDAHYYLGLARFMAGRHEEAAASYAQAIASGYTEPEVVECLGDVLTVLGRDSEAVETYRAALSRRPSAHACARLGEALSRLGRRDEAVAAYKDALQLRLARVAPLYDIPPDEAEPSPPGD